MNQILQNLSGVLMIGYTIYFWGFKVPNLNKLIIKTFPNVY